ncbi:hypothetical protein Tco_0273858 [Tanacetum coccineum]
MMPILLCLVFSPWRGETMIYSGSVTKLLVALLRSPSTQLESYSTKSSSSLLAGENLTNVAYTFYDTKLNTEFDVDGRTNLTSLTLFPASRIRLFIKGKKNSRVMLDSIDNGLLVYPTVEENGLTRPKKYSELTEVQQLQDDCDVQATNIILHGLPPDVLYNLFDKFAYVQGETLYEYYWRFSQPINDMHTIRMTVQQVQVNTKFLNALPPEWSKFVTDVKLAKSLYTTNYDKLYAYLSQHEQHANEVRFHLQTINSECLPIPEIRQPFKMEESQFNKFKKDKLRVLLGIWRNSALSQRGQKVPHGLWRNSDAYDSDCDDISSAKAVLMANLSSCDSDVLSESQDAGIEDTNSSAPNDLLVLSLVEQMTDHVAKLDTENQTNKMVNESLTAELERYKERVAIFEQRQNVDLNKREKFIDSQMDDLIRNRNAKLAAFQQEIDTLKENLSTHVKEKESLSKTLTVFKTESKEKEAKYIDKEIVLEKQNKELENIISLGYQNPFNLKKSQRIKPTLYDGSVIAKGNAVISVIDDEETLILKEESRSKMLDKQNDPISIEKKINIYPIDYSKLNKIQEDFAPSELPKVSLVNESLKMLKYQLASFDKVVKKRTTSDAITADEITEVQTVFNQMEAAVD